MLTTATVVSVKTRGELNGPIHPRPPERPANFTFRPSFILTTRTCAAACNDCVRDLWHIALMANHRPSGFGRIAIVIAFLGAGVGVGRDYLRDGDPKRGGGEPYPNACCKVCSKGKACGNTCISRAYV